MKAIAVLFLTGMFLAASCVSDPVRAQEAQTKGGKPVTEPSPADILEHRVPSPPPVGTRKLDVGVEIGEPIANASFLEHKDGRLIMIGAGLVCYSSDGGKTWTKPEALPVKIEDAIRLNSGKLGGREKMKFYVSEDEGKTWTPVADIRGWPGGPYHDVMLQTKSGRILLPVRITGAGHEGQYGDSAARAMIQGELKLIEGHAHWPEADMAFVFYSDDEGKTWRQSEGAVMVWLKDGFGGMWPCDEPNIIEIKNGDVVMYCRTSLGRIYTAHSGYSERTNKDGKLVKYLPGVRFDQPLRTELASSYSPCRVRRIPKTGDLLCFWNNVSGDEIRAGYRRGRLSTAVSKDDGKSWQHFRTIDRVVLPPAGKVAPDPEPGMARALKNVGELPDDYGNVDYPNIGFHGDNVILTWHRKLVKPRPGDVTGARLRVLPLSWFYEDEPPYKPPMPTPKLLVALEGKEPVEVPSLFCDGRFFVKLSDIAQVLGRKVEADMYAPAYQVLTYLGCRVTYDMKHLKDAVNPRMLATVRTQ